MSADDSAYLNHRQNIYLLATESVYYTNTTVGPDTESEAVYLSDGEAFVRSSYISDSATHPY